MPIIICTSHPFAPTFAPTRTTHQATRHNACLPMPTLPPKPFANFIPTSLTQTQRPVCSTPPIGIVTPRAHNSASKKHTIRTKQKKRKSTMPHQQRAHKRAIVGRKRLWTFFLVLYNIAETCLEIAIGVKNGSGVKLFFIFGYKRTTAAHPT